MRAHDEKRSGRFRQHRLGGINWLRSEQRFGLAELHWSLVILWSASRKHLWKLLSSIDHRGVWTHFQESDATSNTRKPCSGKKRELQNQSAGREHPPQMELVVTPVQSWLRRELIYSALDLIMGF